MLVMSKTNKIHSHISPCCAQYLAGSKAQKSRFRTTAKASLRKFDDPDDVNIPTFRGMWRISAQYLNPVESEREFVKDLLSTRKAILNGAALTNFYCRKAMEKQIDELAHKKNPKCSGYPYSLAELTEDEIRAIAHKHYASKGINNKIRNKRR